MKINIAKATSSATARSSLMPFFMWFGGAVHTAHQPGMGFWDGVVWLYYVGRYIAVNFAVLS